MALRGLSRAIHVTPGGGPPQRKPFCLEGFDMSRGSKIFFLLLFAGILSIWIAYPFIISLPALTEYFPRTGWAARGVVGDSFGALNTLFSGLALTGVALNIYIQTKQLEKLEQEQERNTGLLKEQITALKLTAQLNYYNDEIQRLQDVIKNFSHGYQLTHEGAIAHQNLLSQFDKVREERKKVLEQLVVAEVEK